MNFLQTFILLVYCKGLARKSSYLIFGRQRTLFWIQCSTFGKENIVYGGWVALARRLEGGRIKIYLYVISYTPVVLYINLYPVNCVPIRNSLQVAQRGRSIHTFHHLFSLTLPHSIPTQLYYRSPNYYHVEPGSYYPDLTSNRRIESQTNSLA